MRCVILYDNTSISNDLKPGWGFSAFIEAWNRKILFDTGADGNILLQNMKRLSIDIKEITDIFISHPHWDHIGGLRDVLKLNSDIVLWIPLYFKELDSLPSPKEIVEVKEVRKLYEGIYSTGRLDEIEQALCIESSKGVIVFVGCSHPDIKDILSVASDLGDIYGVIGGLHSNRVEHLQGIKLICPTHCTYYKSRFRELFKEGYIEGGVGRIIELD